MTSRLTSNREWTYWQRAWADVTSLGLVGRPAYGRGGFDRRRRGLRLCSGQAANVGGFLEEFPQVDADDLPIGGWVICDLFGKGAFFGLVFTGVVAWRKAVARHEPEHETAGGWRQCSPGELGVTVLAGLWVLDNLEVPGRHKWPNGGTYKGAA